MASSSKSQRLRALLARKDRVLSVLHPPTAALARVMNLLQDADVRPTAVKLRAIAAARASAARTMAAWNTIGTVDLPALNATLAAAGLPPIAP